MESSRLILYNTPCTHPGPLALPFLPLQEISLIHLPPQPVERLGQISSLKKNPPMSTFPRARSPDGLGPHPLITSGSVR